MANNSFSLSPLALPFLSFFLYFFLTASEIKDTNLVVYVYNPGGETVYTFG